MLDRQQRADKWAKENARLELIDCVECGKKFNGDPKKPHVCPGCMENYLTQSKKK